MYWDKDIFKWMLVITARHLHKDYSSKCHVYILHKTKLKGSQRPELKIKNF